MAPRGAAPSLKPSTWDSYRSNLIHHVLPRLGEIPLRDLGPTDLNRLYVELLDAGMVARACTAQPNLRRPSGWSTYCCSHLRGRRIWSLHSDSVHRDASDKTGAWPSVTAMPAPNILRSGAPRSRELLPLGMMPQGRSSRAKVTSALPR
ncbi:MAG: hypothetical protein H0V60_10130 [Actinobacteria bacterium]|nr:hypothetical protein [Actinomycetota bacterium]